MNRAMRDIPHIHRNSVVVVSDKAEAHYEAYGGSVGNQPESQCIIAVHIDANPAWYLVGQRLEQIESAIPGAGQSVLATIYRATGTALSHLGPDDVLNCASQFHWSGGDSEADRDLVEEGEDVLTRVLTRDQLHERMPRWACHPKPHGAWPDFEQMDRQQEFWPQMKCWMTPILETAAALWTECDRTKLWTNDARQMSLYGHYHVPFVLKWHKDDLTEMLLDEAYNYEMQCGESSDLQWATLFGQEIEEAVEAFHQLPKVFARSHAAEQLACLIAGGIYER
jgi:PRTRC genetic system protein F